MGRKKKTGQVLENLLISGIADKGKSVARDAENRVVFVEGAVPGDVVNAVVVKRKRDFAEAKITEYVQYSPDRVEAACPHFGLCGGCKWQHYSYEAQLAQKQKVVENALLRIGKVQVGTWYPIMGCEEPYNYRNKLEFTFSNKRWLTTEELNSGIPKEQDVLGFHRPGAFDKILDINTCLLQPEPSDEIRNGARDLAIEMGLPFFDLRTQEGLMRTLMMRVTTIGEVLVLVVFYQADDRIPAYLRTLHERHPKITSLCYAINTKRNDSMTDVDVLPFRGEPFVRERLGDVVFNISPKSFFQTNSRQAARLYDTVGEFAELTGQENVYDLYTGTGSIALYLAKNCKQMVGIEEIPEAIDDARVNARTNNIENTVFYVGDVKDILTDDFAIKHGKPDVLITDPPRAGMHAQVVDMLLQLEAPKVVYVSCNPATQARDLQLLSSKYQVDRVRAVDMFPHTHHIESVALLTLRPS